MLGLQHAVGAPTPDQELGRRNAGLGALVDGNAEFSTWRFERVGGQSGLGTTYVEVANLFETEDILVKFRPLLHFALGHVIGQMVDGDKALFLHPLRSAQVDKTKVFIGFVLFVIVDKVNDAFADSIDSRHRRAVGTQIIALLTLLRATLDRFPQSLFRIDHPPAHGRDRRAVLLREFLRKRLVRAVEQKMDVSLPVIVDIPGFMLFQARKTEFQKQMMQVFRPGGSEFDEFDSIQTDGVKNR